MEPNGDVYYLIDDGNRTFLVNTSSESTYFNLTGLQRGVTYNITVVAVNTAGRNDTGAVLKYTHKSKSMLVTMTSCSRIVVNLIGILYYDRTVRIIYICARVLPWVCAQVYNVHAFT